jgi:hypothetical protein
MEGDSVAVIVGVMEGVAVMEPDALDEPVLVVVAVGMAEPDSVPVAERVPVRLAVAERVPVRLAVADGVPVRVAVDEGVPVRLGVELGAATVTCPMTTVRALASSTFAAPAAYS